MVDYWIAISDVGEDCFPESAEDDAGTACEDTFALFYNGFDEDNPDCRHVTHFISLFSPMHISLLYVSNK